MSDNAGLAIEKGSTNIYADLGFPDPHAMLRKAQIVSEMSRTIKARRRFAQQARLRQLF